MWRIDKNKIFEENKIWHILAVRFRLDKSSHPFIPRTELITWQTASTNFFTTMKNMCTIAWNYFHPNLYDHLLCDHHPRHSQEKEVRRWRRRGVTFLIYGRKKCIVIKTGAAIVLSPSSCKSQSQQLIKEKRILMTKKLKTKNPGNNKSRSTHLKAHKNLHFKSSQCKCVFIYSLWKHQRFCLIWILKVPFTSHFCPSCKNQPHWHQLNETSISSESLKTRRLLWILWVSSQWNSFD